MSKKYVCKSIVTGQQRQTKHIVFSHSLTRCFRFGFKISRLKNGEIKIYIVFNNHRTSKTPIPLNLYKETIKTLKIESEKRFSNFDK